MRRILTVFALCSLTLAPTWVLAQEGVDHPVFRDTAPEGRSPHAYEHAHASPHGGQVVTVGKYHYELLSQGKEVRAYLLDGKLKALPLKGVSGAITVKVPGQEMLKANLLPASGYLSAPLDLSGARSYVAIVTLNVEGISHSGRFSKP